MGNYQIANNEIIITIDDSEEEVGFEVESDASENSKNYHASALIDGDNMHSYERMNS